MIKKQKHTCNKALHQTPPLSLVGRGGAGQGGGRGLVTVTQLGHCSLAYQADWHLRRRGLHSLSSPMRWMGGASLSPSHWNPQRSSGLRRHHLRRRRHSGEKTHVRSVSREQCPPRLAAVGRALVSLPRRRRCPWSQTSRRLRPSPSSRSSPHPSPTCPAGRHMSRVNPQNLGRGCPKHAPFKFKLQSSFYCQPYDVCDICRALKLHNSLGLGVRIAFKHQRVKK